MASFLYAADITEGKAFAVRSHVYSVLESCLFVAKGDVYVYAYISLHEICEGRFAFRVAT